jgi:prepilin-type N-terminal cleavage/methylation domain-containing protein
MKKIIRSENGFTLMEILIAVGLLGMLVMGFLSYTSMQQQQARLQRAQVAANTTQAYFSMLLSNGQVCEANMGPSPGFDVALSSTATKIPSGNILDAAGNTVLSIGSAAPTIEQGLLNIVNVDILQKAVLSTSTTTGSVIGEFGIDLEVQGMNTPTILRRTVKFSATQNLADGKILACNTVGGSSSPEHSNPLAETIILNKADLAQVAQASSNLLGLTDQFINTAFQYCDDFYHVMGFWPSECRSIGSNFSAVGPTYNGPIPQPPAFVTIPFSLGTTNPGYYMTGSFLDKLTNLLIPKACSSLVGPTMTLFHCQFLFEAELNSRFFTAYRSPISSPDISWQSMANWPTTLCTQTNINRIGQNCVDYNITDNDANTLTMLTSLSSGLVNTINSINSNGIFLVSPVPQAEITNMVNEANLSFAKMETSRKKLVSIYRKAKNAYDREMAMKVNANIVVCPKDYKIFACSGAMIVSGVTYFPAPQRVAGTTTGDIFEQCKAEVTGGSVTSNNITAICSYMGP